MKIAIYSRKSKSTGKGESIKNQINLCKEHANKHYNVSKFIVYKDDGFSGGSSDRPNYQIMINDAKNCKFNILMCYRLDRISRNIADFSDTIELLQANDISFISLREQFDTSTPMGRAMMYIASVFAQLERETIAERIKDNMLSLARSGRWLGGNTPTGYFSEPIVYYDDYMNEKTMYKLTQIPKELFIVKKLFKKYLELGSLNQVQSWTIENNFRTQNGNNFDVNSIRGILTNMVYVKADKCFYNYCKKLNMDIASDISDFDGIHGPMVYNKNIIRKGKSNKLRPTSEWIIAIGKHKGVISSDKFIKVQKKLNKNKHRFSRKHTNNIALLSSIISCGSCKSKLRTIYGNKRKDGTRPHYYKCILKEKSKNNKCSIKNLNGTLVDNLVLSSIAKLTLNKEIFLNYIRKQREDLLLLNSFNDSSHTNLEEKIKDCENTIQNLTLNLSSDVNSVHNKYIIKQIEELDLNILNMKKELKYLSPKDNFSSNDLKIISSIKNLMKNLKESINNLSFNEKKHIVSTVLSEIIWDGISIKVCI